MSAILQVPSNVVLGRDNQCAFSLTFGHGCVTVVPINMHVFWQVRYYTHVESVTSQMTFMAEMMLVASTSAGSGQQRDRAGTCRQTSPMLTIQTRPLQA